MRTISMSVFVYRFISTAWCMMWHKINIQQIFVKEISEQSHLSSGLFVKNLVVTFELYQIYTSSGLNLFNWVFTTWKQRDGGGEGWRERAREKRKEKNNMDSSRSLWFSFVHVFIIYYKWISQVNSKVRHHYCSETNATRVLWNSDIIDV